MQFRSQTDSEVIPNLINRAYEERDDLDGTERLTEAVRRAAARLRGSFALAVLHREHPDTLIAVRQMSPLVVGLGDGETFSPAMCRRFSTRRSASCS